MGILNKFKNIFTRGKDKKSGVGVEMEIRKVKAKQPEPGEIEEEEAEEEEEEEEIEEEEEEAEAEEEQPLLPPPLIGEPITEKDVQDAIGKDRRKKEEKETNEEDKFNVWGMLDENTPIDEIAAELRLPRRTVVRYKVMKKHEEGPPGSMEIPPPVDIYNPPRQPQPTLQQPQPLLPQQPLLPLPPLPPPQQPQQYPPQTYYPPPQPRDPMLDKLFDLQLKQGQIAEDRLWGVVDSLIKDRGKDDFFGGALGDMLKTKMVTQAFNIGPSAGSEWAQTFNTLLSTGQLQGLVGQGMGLIKDVINKDNPDYDPFEEKQAEGGETMEITQEQFLNELRQKIPKLPGDIAEATVDLIYREMPDATVQEKSKATMDFVKGIDNLKYACIALKTFVIQGDKTPAEAALWVRQNQSAYARLLVKVDLDKVLQRVEPFRTTSLNKYIAWLESDKIRPKVEEFLQYLKDPKLLQAKLNGPPETAAKESDEAPAEPEQPATEEPDDQEEVQIDEDLFDEPEFESEEDL